MLITESISDNCIILQANGREESVVIVENGETFDVKDPGDLNKVHGRKIDLMTALSLGTGVLKSIEMVEQLEKLKADVLKRINMLISVSGYLYALSPEEGIFYQISQYGLTYRDHRRNMDYLEKEYPDVYKDLEIYQKHQDCVNKLSPNEKTVYELAPGDTILKETDEINPDLEKLAQWLEDSPGSQRSIKVIALLGKAGIKENALELCSIPETPEEESRLVNEKAERIYNMVSTKLNHPWDGVEEKEVKNVIWALIMEHHSSRP